MSFRKPSPRTLLVVDLATRKVAYTRDENMNGNPGAKITKPIYELVKSGKGIMFYAHRPDDIRQAVEINGRFYAKPSKWTPKAKVVAPKIRKFVHRNQFSDGTAHIEWDGTTMTAVGTDGTRQPNHNWTLFHIEQYLKDNIIREVTA